MCRIIDKLERAEHDAKIRGEGISITADDVLELIEIFKMRDERENGHENVISDLRLEIISLKGGTK